MKNKKLHRSPMEYRVIWKGEDSVGESIQHYNVFHSSEALDFLAHTLRGGHIHTASIKVIAVEEYNRFSDRWENRTAKASEHAVSPEVSVSDSGVVSLNHME
jgi:hypothetical protein